MLLDRTRNTLIYHSLFWICLYLLWVFAFRNYSFSLTKTLTVEFCYLVFITIDYYSTIYFIIPKFLKRRKYGWFVLSTVCLIAVSAFFRAVIAREMSLYIFINAPKMDFGTVYSNSVVNIFIWVELIIVGKLIFDRVYNQQQLELMEKERIKHELDFLKAQINPHALFNSLNSIYGHIDKKNQVARNILLQFSGLLRYQLYDSMVDNISLEKEVEYIRNYVAFQKIRKDDSLAVDVCIDVQDSGYTIAPLLLVILIENAFKFVSNHSDDQNKIVIKLMVKNNIFTLHLSNTTAHTSVSSAPNPGGIGLVNLKRRLELLYPGKYEINLNRQDSYYEADLKIELE